MISKIIQKEKERQEQFLQSCEGDFEDSDYSCSQKRLCFFCKSRQNVHKQSLINLKEYMEEELQDDKSNSVFSIEGFHNSDNKELSDLYLSIKNVSNNRIKYKKEDIQELNLMIEKYA